MEKKTILEWFNTLPQPIKNEAMYNLKWVKAYNEVYSLADAIFFGFEWELTREGHKYWSELRKQFKNI